MITILDTESPNSGTLDPGSSQNILITFNAGGLPAKNYLDEIYIDSNDPDEPRVTTPVPMTVVPDSAITGTTDSSGKVSLKSDSLKNPSGTFTFTIDNVTRSGWTYDPSANMETSDSINI